MLTETQKQKIKDIRDTYLRDFPTWEAFFGHLEDRLADVAREGMPPEAVAILYLHMASFLLAMKDLPDEAEIGRLLEKAAEIVVVEGRSRVGVELLTVEEREERVRSVAEANREMHALSSSGKKLH